VAAALGIVLLAQVLCPQVLRDDLSGGPRRLERDRHAGVDHRGARAEQAAAPGTLEYVGQRWDLFAGHRVVLLRSERSRLRDQAGTPNCAKSRHSRAGTVVAHDVVHVDASTGWAVEAGRDGRDARPARLV